MRCTCDQNEVPHHHDFGGTYPCRRPDDCRRCTDYEGRVWCNSPLPAASPASLKAARQRHRHRMKEH